MREVKFRAFHKASNQMFDWSDFSINGRNNCIIHNKEGVFTTSYVDDNSVELMQFTGLYDANKTEIYEGDLIRYCDWEAVYIVEWSQAHNSACFQLALAKTANISHPERMDFEATEPHELQVIGNRFQHPELLTQKSK